MTTGPAGIDALPKPPRSLPSAGFALDVVDDVVAYRLHWDANPLRPKRHPRGKFRFDAPRDGAEYAVTYANLAEHGAFAEVYGDSQLISELEATRRLSRLTATRPLKLVALDDPTVQKMLQLDGRIAMSRQYETDDAVEPRAASLVPIRRWDPVRVAPRRRGLPELLPVPRSLPNRASGRPPGDPRRSLVDVPAATTARDPNRGNPGRWPRYS